MTLSGSWALMPWILFATLAVTALGWTIEQLGQDAAVRSAPTRLFMLGLVFLTTTTSVTFAPLWFYKLVNVVRARLYLNVGSGKSVVMTASVAATWIVNAIFLSLATNPHFRYHFLGVRLPTWAYILLGLAGTLVIVLLAVWEVSLNVRRERGLALQVVMSLHALNALLQFGLLILMLRALSAGNATTLDSIALYLTACVCGTLTVGISWSWRGYFSENGRSALICLAATLIGAWVYLTMAAYAHGL